MSLTATQIRYLVAIQSLTRDGVVRSADIADYLGVKKPTVHSMLAQLAKLKLITKEKYSVIELTEFGKNTAEAYAVQFLKINILISKHLNLPSEAVEEGAFAILSCLNESYFFHQQAGTSSFTY